MGNARRPLPLGNKVGARYGPASSRRYWLQQHPNRPTIGAAQVGANATNPIASSVFSRFNSQFRVLPSITAERTGSPLVQTNTPGMAPGRLALLRKQMKQATKTQRQLRRRG